MTNDPVFVWIDWTSWLFGFGISTRNREIGLHFGPVHVSIVGFWR